MPDSNPATNNDKLQSPDSNATSDEAATMLFARFKAASGGRRWDDVRALQFDGTLSAGGLSGEYHATRDVLGGRFASRHKLGSINGQAGYDGHMFWQRGPGGEIVVLDAPEAKRSARSQAWLDARGYWYPQRIAAACENIAALEVDDRAYHVITVRPEDGDPIALWFAVDTHLLVRSVRHRGGDTVTTVLDDYRDVDGLKLPFSLVTDRADATGQVDARHRMQITLDRITVGVDPCDADFSTPAMVASARIDDASGATCVPFDLINNHIYVDGVVDGQSVRFMVDTGGVNLLTPAAARRLGLASEGKLGAGGPGEARVDAALAHAGHVRVGAATLDNPVFYVIDLGELPQAEGVAFDGLVGFEMFRHFGVQIDYADKRLTLTEQAKFTAPADATELAFAFDRLTPIVAGTLDGVPVRLTVDTGSRVSLTLYSPFVGAHGLVAKYDAAPESVLGWGVGGSVKMRAVRFGRLQLGGLVIEDIAGDLYTGAKGALANPDQSGNLGGGLLKRFTVTFDYVAKRIYLAPNATIDKPQAFDRSGLWLLQDGNAIKVADVANESPAALAGIRENDRIVAIAGDSVATRTLAEWREVLCGLPAGTECIVQLLRDGEEITAVLALVDRIPARWGGLST